MSTAQGVHIAKEQYVSWIWKSSQEPENRDLVSHAKKFRHYPVDLQDIEKVEAEMGFP